MASQLKTRFPFYRALAGVDFSSSEINEALVRQLHRYPSTMSSWSAPAKRASPRHLACSRRQIGGTAALQGMTNWLDRPCPRA